MNNSKYNARQFIDAINLEQANYVLWSPFFWGIGVLCYFCSKEEPDLYLLLPLSLGFLVIMLLKKLSFIWPILIIILGMIAPTIKSHNLNYPILNKKIDYTYLEGTVEDVISMPKAHRIILSSPEIEYLSKKDTPSTIRISARTDVSNIIAGDRIALAVSLIPPSPPVFPGGYDFGLRAYFEGVGAVGYSLSKARVIGSTVHNTTINFIAHFRQRMFHAITEILGQKIGPISAALMIGEYQAIDKKILENLRIAGVSHILSVSGMHLSMVAAICFFVIRILLNLCFMHKAKFDVKKAAALVALCGSLAYLLVSGMQVAAVRSFILVAMTILAVMLDRINAPMRALSIAALIILCIQPESILNPSFQMSFAAVMALVASYEYYVLCGPKNNVSSYYSRIKFYFISTTFSSIIASLATAPYAIYHFNQYSNYSVIANLIVVPITSFIIMPCVMLGFLLYPIGLLKFALIPMGYGIEMTIKISTYISTWPYSQQIIRHLPSISLVMITIALYMFAVMRTKLRFIAIIPLIIAISIFFLQDMPDLMVDGKSRIFAYKNHDGKLIFSGKKMHKFTKETWSHYFGQDKPTYALEYRTPQSLLYENGICTYRNQHTLTFACNKLGKNISINGDIYINGKLFIEFSRIIKSGVSFIYATSSHPKFESVAEDRGNHPWNKN